MKKDEKWTRPRHGIIVNLANCILGPYTRLRYGISVKRLPRSQRRQFLILYNHQTAFDQFFVGMAYPGPVYYLATEDIFSLGWISSLLRFAVAPIPIKKQTTDVKAVMNCIRVAREGGTLAIAPEGNRTYSGKTEYIKPAIAAMARKLKLPIAFLRIEGGYGVQPRWSDVVRRGKMTAQFSRILEPEEYAQLTNEQLNDIICQELYVNEAREAGPYHHRRSAEYLERAMYVCPRCGLSVLESSGDTVRCTKCGIRARYLPSTALEGVEEAFPFRFVNDWYEYQQDYVNQMDLEALSNRCLYTDTVKMSRVIVYQHKELLEKKASMSLYGDRVEVVTAGGTTVLPFREITAASVLGRNKLNIYHGDQVYQFKGSKRFNALKYVNLYHRYKNIEKGDVNGKFLGL